MLFPETTIEDGFEIVERIRKEIEYEGFTVPTSVTPIKVTMSFGIAGRSGDAQSSKELVHNADTAVYHSKLRGRNRTHIYTDQIYQGLFQPADPAEHPTDLHPEPPGSQATLPSQETLTETGSRPIQPLVKKPEPTPTVNPRPDWQINLFILGIALAAGSLLLTLNPPTQDLELVSLLVFMGIVFFAEWFSVDIYVRNTSVSTSAAPVMAGIILFGPQGAVLLSLAFAVAAYLKHRSPFSRFAFNFSNQLLGTLICIAFIQWTGFDFTSQEHLVKLSLTLLLGMILYFSTTFMVSTAMHLSLGNPLREIWREHFSWLAAYYLVMGMIAYTLLFSFQQAGLIGTMIVVAPLGLLRLSQKQYLDRTRAMVNELKGKNVILERSSSEISTFNEGLLKTLAEVVDLRDPFVLGHSQQVTQYAVQIAKKMGLEKNRIEIIRQASLLHDIGKLGIPEQILLKPARLTSQEYSIVKEHVTLGAEILEASPSLHELIPIVRHHHEHYDGTGYPDRLQGESIPIEARIVAVADAIEAMASDRPYRRAMKLDQILEELRKCKGTQFDPQVVQAFEEIAADENTSLVVNSARQDINLRLHTDLDEIYHHLLNKKPVDSEQESITISGQPIGSVAIDFAFTTLPGNR
jgi:putative nucleotidyltransferase with HDIG domain